MIAEFNTFASPTEEEAKERISNILNLSWSGWIGRYFPDLNSDEVPSWVIENYEKFHGTWNLKGDGIVFVDKNDFVFVLSGSELKENERAPLFTLSKQGKEKFDLDESQHYEYWFDIVEARNRDEVYANYKLPVTKTGKEKVAQYGIPESFAAIIHHQNRKYSTYYFAGDFSDEPEIPAIYQSELLTFWKKNFTLKPTFYWNTYVPMMKKILAEGLYKKGEDKELIEVLEKDGIKTNSVTTESTIQVLKNGKWEDMLVKGVNMGIAKPGYFPGEAAITKAEYLRWFQAIGDMNANTVRVYTLHPPAFYEAFYEYNQSAKKPLYLIHGAWVNEEKLVSSQNAFSNDTTEDFQKEIKKVIDAIHGNAQIPDKAGHASGSYTWDISKYVLGLLIGIEWDPEAVLHTNQQNPDQAIYTGVYFNTKDATPFEGWLARMLDFTTQYESNQYHWQHSVSFSNWVTTDLLEHPKEPLESEDLVSVDPNHIVKTERFKAGFFASYHIYPYYPDSLNLDETYTNYRDSEGKKNNYAGYLHQLIKAHKLPVVVAEFGVPSSRGLTHKNVYGMNQGALSEKEQGQINQRLFKSIVAEGYAGGVVFSWQDEWFKRTWNTMDYDDPNRRPYWSNVQTNEQHFGLLGFDTGKQGKTMYVDGNDGDWTRNNIKPIYSDENRTGLLQKAYIHADETNVYVRLDYNEKIDWDVQSTHLLFDTITNQGQMNIPLNDSKKINTNIGVDFLINLYGEKESKILVDSYYDPFYYQYGHQLHMIPEIAGTNEKNNGMFNPIRLALNKKLEIPDKGINIKFQDVETGKLLYGNGNPDSEQYQSLTDVSISKDQKMLEMRIPWQLLNVKDPSQRLIMSNIWEKGIEGVEKTEGIRIGIVTNKKDGSIQTFPTLSESNLDQKDAYLFQWKEWEQPSYQERLKESYFIMKETYANSGK
ncbi:hypothetical protein [Bacillus sp. T3]|uniref:hypothetical protein n=1 Tax=Bacillus sp. T3 TaxID=467262 RepID=UPI002981C25E|nr:hypothetical protein [Bacillus sp. T3]